MGSVTFMCLLNLTSWQKSEKSIEVILKKRCYRHKEGQTDGRTEFLGPSGRARDLNTKISTINTSITVVL